MLKDYLHLHFVVLILGFTAILGRLVSVDVFTLVLLRTGLASVGMGFLLFYKKKALPSPHWIKYMIAAGIVLSVHWICFFGSARLSTVSVCLIVFSTTSFFTSIIEPIYFRRKIQTFEIVLGIMVVVGIACIFNFEPQYYRGIIVGLIGALLAAIFTIMNTRLAKQAEPIVINLVELSAAFSFVGLLLIVSTFMDSKSIHFSVPTLEDWLWIVVLAWGCTLYPYLKLLDLLKRFSAFTVNLSVNMEPIYGIVLALLFFGESEKMSNGFYLGSLIILSTLLLHFFYLKKQKASTQSEEAKISQ